MKRRTLLQGIVATSAFSVRSFAYAQSAADTEPFGFALEHRTDRRDAPIVYFVRDVTPEALERLYATMQKAAPDVIGGKVAIKMSFESDAAPRLDPALVGVLAKKTDATLIDNNVYSARRDNAKDHRELARDHGYAAVAPIDILDADGDMELPITGGVILKHAMTGKHFADYDSVISLVRFKPHYLPRYGGTLKNLSICMGSLAGKAWIHSGGKVSSHYVYSDENTTSQAMADAAKGAVDAKKNRWMFFNV
ncbi:MAG: DUF362 domain-containing protein, partial [Sutterellaceae bacterium]|nr:DUF362 domain-containing protein [Sutterellaceae bacterium]